MRGGHGTDDKPKYTNISIIMWITLLACVCRYHTPRTDCNSVKSVNQTNFHPKFRHDRQFFQNLVQYPHMYPWWRGRRLLLPHEALWQFLSHLHDGLRRVKTDGCSAPHLRVALAALQRTRVTTYCDIVTEYDGSWHYQCTKQVDLTWFSFSGVETPSELYTVRTR